MEELSLICESGIYLHIFELASLAAKLLRFSNSLKNRTRNTCGNLRLYIGIHSSFVLLIGPIWIPCHADWPTELSLCSWATEPLYTIPTVPN